MAHFLANTAVFQIGSPLVTVAQVESIDGFGWNYEMVNTTVLGDTVQKFLKGIAAGASITVKLSFDPNLTSQSDGATGMLGYLVNVAEQNCAIVLPTSPEDSFTFTGLVSGFALSGIQVNGRLAADFMIQITSVPTLA
ncbi:hypothetical protein UFOVP1122_4 [uncultured Caudovirales phage]|uniref:Uncharacterized protein n=1 Tax=uncultured Caudovirales phage TaxID=2100421 RepID=A0A6J5QII3_9CAUD|nr:hypothetical protein UFOVP1122_4 [uncultured Caudovirales phage]